MTNQEIFDKVYIHLLTQNQRAINLGNSCRYRQDGLMCAAGCLIPDEIYTAGFEGSSFNSSILRPVHEYLKLNTDQICLINELQRLHDGVQVTEWSKSLEVIANFYGLKIPSETINAPI